ncbi:MAG TPA: pantetheine-phosphate adenylyltransferase [Planctomycetota bacterium]|nr:pantetheine-phosphate adenylyltransferase [Planctomycetota bacterium]
MTRTGFFAGSFDPPTLGHMDLVARARRIVDEVVVGVGSNADKTPWLPVEERLALLSALLGPGVRVVAFAGLAVEAARAAGAGVLLRGVRSEADVASELQMALANRRLAPELETVVLVGSPDVAHISSRLVREVHRSGGDVTLFVPAAVAARLARQPGPLPAPARAPTPTAPTAAPAHAPDRPSRTPERNA